MIYIAWITHSRAGKKWASGEIKVCAALWKRRSCRDYQGSNGLPAQT